MKPVVIEGVVLQQTLQISARIFELNDILCHPTISTINSLA